MALSVLVFLWEAKSKPHHQVRATTTRNIAWNHFGMPTIELLIFLLDRCCFGDFVISMVVLSPVFLAETVQDGFFIADQPVKKGKRCDVEFFFSDSGFDEFGLPETRSWRGSRRCPNDDPFAGTHEGESSIGAIPSGAGAVEFEVAVLPFPAVTAGALESFRGQSDKAILDELITCGVGDILSPEEHLLLQAICEITKVAGRESGGGDRHGEIKFLR